MESQESQAGGKLIKIGHASSLLGVSTQTLRDWVDKDIIECTVLPSGHRRFDEEMILKMSAAGYKEPEGAPEGEMKCDCGYWCRNFDDDDMARKERKITERISRYTVDHIKYCRDKGDWEAVHRWEIYMKQECIRILLRDHLVPFRKLVFAKRNLLNPNYSDEKATISVYACPKCGTLKVNEEIDFFFEPRRAREKQEEWNRDRKMLASFSNNDPW